MNMQVHEQRHAWPRVRLLVLILAGSGLFLAVVLGFTSQTAAGQPLAPQFSTPACVDFEDLSLGTQYNVGDSFVDSGAVMSAHPFTWSDGTVFTGGLALVDNSGMAGGAGQELQVNNVNVAFDYGRPLTALSFRFGEYGGNLNIEVNGDFRNFDNFADIDGSVIGGVDVSVVNGLGNDTGFLRLSGPIELVIVGGQELWLDDVCPETDCVDFEDLTSGATYSFGDTFLDSGVPVSVESFVWGDGTVFTGGVATVDNMNLAGGSGLDVNANNVNLAFHFPFPLPGMSFDFGEYGGNVNLEVNGDFRNVDDFADLDGTVVGNTQVVVVGSGPLGRVFLFGPVSSFAVGGQELWLDNICPESGCVDFESVPSTAVYSVGDDFFDSEAHMTLHPFTWSDGTVFTGGMALVDNSGMAGGTGQDMNLNNINIGFDFGEPVSGLSLLFGEYGGNLNIEINGDFANFTDFVDIDSQVIGGASVSVINGLGNDKGKLTVDGLITSFKVGGQELWIDDVCATRLDKIYLPVILRP